MSQGRWIETDYNKSKYRTDWEHRKRVTKWMHSARQGLPYPKYWQFPLIDVSYPPDKGKGYYTWKAKENPPRYFVDYYPGKRGLLNERPREDYEPRWMRMDPVARRRHSSFYNPEHRSQPPDGFNWYEYYYYKSHPLYPPHYKAYAESVRHDDNSETPPPAIVRPSFKLVESLAKDYVASHIKNPYVSALTKWQKRLPTTHSNLIQRNMTEMPDAEIPEGWTRQELIDAGVDGANVIGRGPLFALGKIGGKKIVLPGTGLFNRDPTIGLRGNIHDNLYNKKGRYLLAQKKTPLYLGDELVDPKAIDTLPIEKLDEILPKPWSQMSPSEKVRHTIMSKGLAIGRALGITQKHYSPGIYSPPEQQGSSMNLGQMPSIHNEGTGPDAIIPPTIPAANQAGGVRGGSGGGSVGFSEDFASRLRKARYGASQLLQTYTTDEEAIRTIEKYDDAAKQGKRARSMIESNLNGSQKRARQVLFKNPVANTMTEEEFNRLISV